MMVLERLSAIIDKSAKNVSIVLMGFLAVITFLNVALRDLINVNYVGAYDIIRILMMWSICLGISVVYQKKHHTRYEFLYGRFKGTWAVALDVFINCVCAGFFIYLIVGGKKLIPIVSKQIMPASGMAMAWLYWPLVLTAGIMLLHTAVFLYHDIFKRRVDQQENSIDGV